MKKQSKKPGDLPQALTVQFPESEFDRFFRAKMVELDRVKREHEDKWGVGRVIALVDAEFRIKVWKQAERVWEASKTEDTTRLASACDGMIRAYRAMDSWAVAEGIGPVEIKALEWENDDGVVMAVVQTDADAVAYQRIRKDVQCLHIWTMAEIGTIMASGIGRDIANLKAEIKMPATVVSVTAGAGSGFEDWENDLDLNEPDTMPKMFNTKAAESLRKRSKA
jgi:hypothetical protein